MGNCKILDTLKHMKKKKQFFCGISFEKYRSQYCVENKITAK